MRNEALSHDEFVIRRMSVVVSADVAAVIGVSLTPIPVRWMMDSNSIGSTDKNIE